MRTVLWKEKRKSGPPLVLSLILLTIFSSTTWFGGVASASVTLAFLPPCDAIGILSDSEFTPENGVSRGSGTAEDPYVIENCEIPASYPSVPVFSNLQAGVFIANTTASVIVRNIWVEGGGGRQMGIALFNASNVVVESSRVWSARFGVYMQGTTNSKIISGLFWSLTLGLVVGDLARSSPHNTISGNIVHDVDIAVLVVNSTQNSVAGNTIFQAARGIWVEVRSSENLVTDNHVSDSLVGIEAFASSHGNVIRGNLVERIEILAIGIGIESSGNIVEYNEVRDTPLGINLNRAFDSVVSFNTVYALEMGVKVLRSEGNRLSGNSIVAPVGIHLCSIGANQLGPPPNVISATIRRIEHCPGWLAG